ncbi:hypothetical protein DFA_06672 [Cavenderia fasciculata]|uniref:Uncharacterized protein n=1 Tax=Cavenderia fasciculata TaxID=261658 RepID=F4Q1Y6_CACFS|nr:uncharacterized protein DFA_06672 [Cavenderia fasciculata]EGG18006.1 hypothetical protein DFA_06672 [Cavenderia fasciculata]|eukprot:XP_004356899.1 hypothetical protein DFA_06672 [Cavenderia fasciculata]
MKGTDTIDTDVNDNINKYRLQKVINPNDEDLINKGV